MHPKSIPDSVLSITRSLGLALIIGLLALWLSKGVLDRLELAAGDLLFWVRGPLEEASPVVIVAIDDASFSRTGLRWPWPRDYIAQIVDAVTAGDPAVIAIDVFFYDTSDAEADRALAEAIANAGNVVLVSHITYQSESGFSSQQWNRPLPEIETAARAIGLTNFPRDPDGTVRRLTVFQEHSGERLFSWSMHLARLYLGETDFTVVSEDELHIGEQIVELTGRNLLVNYRGPAGSIPHYSAYQVADGTIDPYLFNGKIVLIGATSETLHDSYPTPWGSNPPMPGVEINANAVETILNGRFVHPLSDGAALVIALLAALVGMGLTLRLRPVAGLSVVVGLTLAYATLGAILFTQSRVMLPIIASVVALGLTYTVGTSIQLYEEQQKRAHVRALFERYVSPAVIDEMLAQHESYTLGGQRRDLTVLFSDIRGFTALSERLSPDEVVALLNEYLSAMTEIVFEYGGMVDKFQGDAILAIFNAPLPVEDHATRAVQCAIEMMTRLADMQASWEATGQYVLQIGIGINTGQAFVGNIGSARRMEYTAIGDTVNLASRLQDLTKDQGVPILFSEATHDRLSSDIKTRFVTRAQVKGRVQAVNVFTVVEESQ